VSVRDVLKIGAGPSGLSAAIAARHRDLAYECSNIATAHTGDSSIEKDAVATAATRTHTIANDAVSALVNAVANAGQYATGCTRRQGTHCNAGCGQSRPCVRPRRERAKPLKF
jgi:hypothetical protein